MATLSKADARLSRRPTSDQVAQRVRSMIWNGELRTGDRIALDAMEQTLQVAESGHGIAMGRRPVVDSWLERGRLVAPFGEAGPTGAAYYLCRPTGAMPTAAGRRLERWLSAAAADWRGTTGEGAAKP